MKIQGLAIIFIIIILPISIVIGEYARTQIETFRLEQLYDTWLITATDDALKAFQINAFNDVTSKLPDSKINSIEASANAFYNSMESSFRLNGYSKEELQMYVPALVYTMYDGYYIYSPYTNVAKITEKENGDTGNDIDSEYTEKELTIDLNSSEKSYGFKPYVYYSSRYKVGPNSDFVINYSLDNYITIQGIIDGNYVYKSGYLLTIAGSSTDNGVYVNGDQVYYNGVQILQESNLEDWLYERNPDGNIVPEKTGKSYKYIKENGTKYYMNEDCKYIFYWYGGDITIIRDEPTYNSYKDKIENNTSAIQYYKDAYEFTTWVNENSVLKNLKTSNAEAQVKNKGEEKIFENNQIESPSSNFNLHRKEVIRASIETNLSVAIANFNSYTNSVANFQMPELKETDWELLQNEISIISFLQGLNIGGKRYNGYTVVTNGKTEEVVKEESIYITTDDGYYHKINDKHFQKNQSGNYEYEGKLVSGVLKSDFEIRKDATVGLSYIYKNQLGCYTSIVSQESVDNTYDSIYEYLLKTDDLTPGVKQIYYTALGRERYGTYKVEHSLINSSLITD